MTTIAIAQESTTVGRNVATTDIPIDAPQSAVPLSVTQDWVGQVYWVTEVVTGVTGVTDSAVVGSESKQ